MAHTDEFKRKLRLGTACALVSALGVVGINPAMAQDSADTEEEILEVEEVVVTGSRIKRAGFDTVQPATQIDAEFLADRGFTNIAEALNQLPSFGTPGSSSNDNASGGRNTGQNFVNAFGLGSARTLTLINGRRTVGQNTPTTSGTTAAAGLQVDLNIIPTAMIERIETIYTGGAPIYGSDAIAGTVNVILKDDYEGMNVDVQYGISEKGDAGNLRARMVMGGNFMDDRGNIVLSYEYAKQNELLAKEREEVMTMYGFKSIAGTDPLTQDHVNVWSVPNSGLPLAAAGSNGGPFLTDDGTPDGNPILFGLDGEFITFDEANLGDRYFVFFSNGAHIKDGSFYDNPYVSNLPELTSLANPLERHIVTTMGHYDLNDNITFNFETLFARSTAEANGSQPEWSINAFGPGVSDQFAVNINDNPFLSSSNIQTLIANGLYDPALDDGDPLTDDDAQFFWMNRSHQDIYQGATDHREQDVFRFVAGLEGDFELGERTWSWDVAYIFGQTSASTETVTINGTRFSHALDAVIDPATGEAACRINVEGGDTDLSPDIQDDFDLMNLAGCIPFNPFGVGDVTDEQREYYLANRFSSTTIQQQVFEANLVGELFDLPAGAVGFAGGITHRRESGSFRPDQASELGLDRGVNKAPVIGVDGSFNTVEAYAEVLVPLTSNGEGIAGLSAIFSDFEIEAALRHVDNSRAGKAETWTIGARITPNIPGIRDSLMLRGNYTEAIRAPSITELFLPQIGSRGFASDPCDTDEIDNGPNPTARRANCEAEFAAFDIDEDAFNDASNSTEATLENYEAVMQNASQPLVTGGNPNLLNESSKSWSVGFVFQPEFIPGLSLSADWTDIELSDAIVQLTATQLARACYDDPNYPDVPACSQFEREAGTFQFQNPVTGFVNAASREFSGLIANLDYSFALDDLFSGADGMIQLTTNYFYTHSHSQTVGGFDLNEFQGEKGFIRHRWNSAIRYSQDRFSTMLQWQHQGPGIYSNEDAEDAKEFSTYEAWDVFNATFNYQISDKVSARIVVNNIFDKFDTPRQQAATNTNNVNLYDAVGRRFIFGISANF